jgi:HD-GYP domain-containing protein (c-di-GMP phosphodiesterase class II)
MKGAAEYEQLVRQKYGIQDRRKATEGMGAQSSAHLLIMLFVILSNIAYLEGAIPCVLHHHERYDGSGYPQHLAGADIPLPGRIIAVADAFDAMTTDRPYRRAWPPRRALAELRREAGKQFDPAVVRAFLRVQPKLARLLKRPPGD